MEILVPIDGSECSMRALRFACEMADRYDGSLHAVHVTDMETDATEEIVRRATEVCDEEGVDDEPEVLSDSSMQFQPSRHVGKDVIKLVQERGYDHVVMGHHGSGAVGRAILGSAAETVVRANEVPVTVIP
jgi:nucleotide-binding universal stress UspA family protein